MRSLLAAFLLTLGALLAAAPGYAQQNPAARTVYSDNQALSDILGKELSPETKALADKLVQLTGSARLFDEVLPDIADKAKNAFIRANPQMQLGIISVVDKVAVELVSRRKELDDYLARVWAAGFTDDEMQELIDFFSTETGKKYATSMPKILAVETAAAQEWGNSIGDELNARVQAELRKAMQAETEALQSDVAGPATDQNAPQQ
jgi:uncharacterized protein